MLLVEQHYGSNMLFTDVGRLHLPVIIMDEWEIRNDIECTGESG